MERKTTKSHIEFELPDGRVTTIKELVRKYDDNKDGKIGRTELGNLLTDCNEGKRPSEEEIEYFHRIAAKLTVMGGQQVCNQACRPCNDGGVTVTTQ